MSMFSPKKRESKLTYLCIFGTMLIERCIAPMRATAALNFYGAIL